MALGEFDLIGKYFGPLGRQAGGAGEVVVGIGDDAAVLAVPPGMQLVASLDTLVEGRHFRRGAPAGSVGHRALAVNLSDLAAMGAQPAWYLLSLTLPEVDEAWLAGFVAGMDALARRSGIRLVGGDTTRGPLAIAVQVMGLVPAGRALLRSGARPGDLLYVSGAPGEAAAGLALALAGATGDDPDGAGRTHLLHRFHYPEPRLALGQALRGLASACIDVSDGLAADALHLAQESGCGLFIDVQQLPLGEQLLAASGERLAREQALSGGDDYELCFTLPAARAGELPARLGAAGGVAHCIGRMEATPGLRLACGGVPYALQRLGFDHFPAGG